MKKEHYSNDYLNALSVKYPNAWTHVNTMRQDRGKDLPKWGEYCFLPMAAWYSIISAEYNIDRLDPVLVPDVAKLAAIGAWRYTKGVYRFHPDIFDAIATSTVKKSLPVDVLLRLPEWSLFIELPENYEFLDVLVSGFFVHLEQDMNTNRVELRFLLVTEDGFIPQILHMGNWTVSEAIDRAVTEAKKQNQFFNDQNGDYQVLTAAAIQPLLSLVLYLCSDEPEIGIPGQRPPSNPRPKRTKKGWKMFPADNPRFFQCGFETGEKLGKSRGMDLQKRKGRKDHIRRAHWHGYWRGTDQDKEFYYKWLPPVFVSSDD